MNRNATSVIGLWVAISFALVLASYARAYDEITVTNGATIRGIVKVEGKLPNLPPLQITKYKEVCKDVPNENLIVGPGQGLRYAVVTLEGITKGKAVEREAQHELDNVRCRFVPHVLAASVGQFLVMKNTDPILHTVHAFFTNGQPQFNIGLYPGRTSRKPLVTPGLVKILCEVHPWMSAYLVVTEHPYHAVTDAYGEYLINDVPAGTYKLKLWHESLGSEEKSVEVRAGGSSNVDFVFVPKPGVKK
ncbi:MAG: carboxypeptidase regulatory-like domain-containing protein [Alphaproteobacteria bacterium]